MQARIIIALILAVFGFGNGSLNTKLDKEYSNKYFSLHYPSSWEIMQEENQVTERTTVSLQIVEKQKNDYDFRPNINIIIANKKWEESTSYVAEQVSKGYINIFPGYKKLKIMDARIDNCKGSVLQYSYTMQGYFLRSDQYIVKKADNTTYIITAAMDGNKYQQQKAIIQEILNSIKIK
jgi:hypothetical protein